jgi:hypothetical protein
MNIIAANNFVKYEPVDAAEAIRFAVTGCDLGKVLVARSRTGVCAILLGTNAEELEVELGKIFPDDVFIRNERAVTHLRAVGLSHSGFQVAPGDRSGLRRQSDRPRCSLPSRDG